MATSSPTESIPSLADDSLGGSSQSSTEANDDIRRNLFQTPQLVQTKNWEAMITDIASPFRPAGPQPPKVRSGFGPDKNNSMEDESHGALKGFSVKTGAEKSAKSASSAVVTGETRVTPVSPPSSQLQRTSVKQLVGLFSVFDGLKPQAQHAVRLPEKNEALPLKAVSESSSLDIQEETRWKHKAASLERECNALQGIVCTDSVNMTKLTREVETLRESNSRHISEIALLSSDLKKKSDRLNLLEHVKEGHDDREAARLETIRMLKDELEHIKEVQEDNDAKNREVVEVLNEEVERAKEENADRELARLETIRVLKEEIDRLTQGKIAEADSLPPDDLAQMQFEHELFARQILRDENALKEASANIEKKENLILQLKKRMEVMRARLLFMEPLQSKVDSLVQEKQSMALRFEQKLKMKEQEINEMQGLLKEARDASQKNSDDEALDGSLVTEIHLAETEQDLETALQLLKEQEQHIWRLESRIYKLTPGDRRVEAQGSGQKLPGAVPDLWCAS